MRRRDALVRLGLGGLAPGWLFSGRAAAQGAPAATSAAASPPAGPDLWAPFNDDVVAGLARQKARSPYRPPNMPAPPGFDALSYDEYRKIRFRPERSFWADLGLPFHFQTFLRGFLAKDAVRLYEVADGRTRPIWFDPSLYDFPPELTALSSADTGFAGLRLQWPLNTPGVFDEIGVFQGASYFRSLGRRQGYGISGRGIAIGSGDPGEEFPNFESFWIERPAPGDAALTVHALLDGPSLAGAYRFVITPGDTTVFDVQAKLYPRTAIGRGGAAAASSMYLFGAKDDASFDDFRASVHDSDGLEMWTGAGERLWRPLSNPKQVQFSAFRDDSPKGFGLMQRSQDFEDYGDLEARYENRPSLWVEPLDAWGPGAVTLVELPTVTETTDNIVCFWRPAEPWKAGSEVVLRYRLHWGPRSLAPVDDVARVVRTRSGAADRPGEPVQYPAGTRLIAVDFAGGPLDFSLDHIMVSATSSFGDITHVTLAPHVEPRTVRASFAFTPPAKGPAELRMELTRDGKVISEAWLHRWTT